MKNFHAKWRPGAFDAEASGSDVARTQWNGNLEIVKSVAATPRRDIWALRTYRARVSLRNFRTHCALYLAPRKDHVGAVMSLEMSGSLCKGAGKSLAPG